MSATYVRTPRSRTGYHRVLLLAVGCLLTFVLTACGDSSSPQDQNGTGNASDRSARVVDAPQPTTIDDLTALGMKVGKSYDVSTLTGATSANLLYWRVNGTAVEYELRWYANHADAVSLGTAPAQEGSGPDAIIDVDEAVYKEGVRDRRTIFDFRAEPKPKYGAYGIYGNLVMLCEGRDDAEAWARCQALVDELSAN